MRRGLKRLIVLATGNLVIFLAMLIGANLLAAVAIDLRVDRLVKHDSRWALPNYQNNASAKVIFEEFNSLRSVYRPYVGWSRREFQGEATTIGSAGDRIHGDLPSDPSRVVRFFGGSTMWGTGAADAETIPAIFNQLYPQFAVHNHGESGFLPRQSLARLINIALAREPLDLVLFYNGVNQVWYYCSEAAAFDRHGQTDKIARRTSGSQATKILYGSLFEAIQKLVTDADLFEAESERLDQSRCERDPAYANRVVEHLFDIWRMARRIVTASEGRFVALLQPVAYVGKPMRDHLSLSLDSKRARNYRIIYGLIKKKLTETRDHWILDMTDAVDVAEPVYIDFCHISGNGNRIITQRLVERLHDNGWLPPPETS